MNLSLHFGAFVPALAKQLAESGLQVDKRYLEQLQRDANAVVLLLVHGLLTDSEINRVRRKLMKKIVAAARVR
jgi:hypothetical protein